MYSVAFAEKNRHSHPLSNNSTSITLTFYITLDISIVSMTSYSYFFYI